MKNRIAIATLLFIAVAGTLLSVHLTKEHYVTLSGSRTDNASCNISERINCDAVTLSPFSEIGDIALSSFSIGYFLLLFLLAAWVASKATSNPTRVHKLQSGLLVSLTILAASASLVYTAISLFLVKAVCIYCMITHTLNFIALALVVMANRGEFVASLSQPWLWLRHGVLGNETSFGPRWHVAFALLVTLACFTAPILWDINLRSKMIEGLPGMQRLTGSQQERLQQLQEQYLFKFRNTPAVLLNTFGSPSQGPENAELTLVEFSDFGCPFCKKAAFITKAMVRRYQDRARLVFKHYPLDNECNRRMQRSMHPFACKVARGSICALDQDRFWEYHDAVFDLETKFTANTATDLAKQLQLDLKAFKRCIRSEKTRSRLRRDIEEAERSGVRGTPAFFFNGRQFSGFLQPMVMQALIEEALMQTPSKG